MPGLHGMKGDIGVPGSPGDTGAAGLNSIRGDPGPVGAMVIEKKNVDLVTIVL